MSINMPDQMTEL